MRYPRLRSSETSLGHIQCRGCELVAVPRKIQVVVALDGLRLVTHSDLLDGNLLAQSRETNSSS